MRKIVGTALTALLMSVIGLVAVSSPAQAFPRCPSISRCAFSGYHGTGTMGWEADFADRPGCFSLGGWSNQIRSIDNLLSGAGPAVDLRVYNSSTSCVGSSAIVYKNTEGDMAGAWYLSIDSIYVY